MTNKACLSLNYIIFIFISQLKFGAYISELARSHIGHRRQLPFMNANHFSVSVGELNRHDYIGNSMFHAVLFIQHSFNAVVNPDNVKKRQFQL